MTTPSPPGAPGGAGAPRPRVALTIGKLDGVHAGHRHLLAQVIETADQRGLEPAAVMLHPDPAAVLADRRVTLLTTLAERRRRLHAFGVRHVWTMPFDRSLASLAPAAFINRLARRLDLAALVVGPDFALGRARAGTPEVLAQLGASRGFDGVVAQPLVLAGHKVGSRAIRAHIAAGDIAGATRLLRAPPRLVGTVVAGAARGRTLGFPTANLDLAADFELPADGVYTVAARWRWPGRRPRSSDQAHGLASIGLRPTFGGGERLVEVYLLDFAGDLYGAEMTVDFLLRQRGELSFATPAELMEQMAADEAQARAFLAQVTGPSWQCRATHAPGRMEITGRGPDLAAALGQLSTAWRAAAGPVAPAVDLVRRRVVLAGATDAELSHAWLGYLAAQPVARAEVYQAGAGSLHALVGADGPASPAHLVPASVRLADGPAGWVTATANVIGAAQGATADQR
jgi:riboflavin kinase/FMN adenylyltransferase